MALGLTLAQANYGFHSFELFRTLVTDIPEEVEARDGSSTGFGKSFFSFSMKFSYAFRSPSQYFVDVERVTHCTEG